MNAQINYYIISGNVNESFYIDKLHGNLYTNGILDREEKSQYYLVVKATNDPNFILPGEDNLVYDKDDASVAVITVNIDDVNDSPPVFSKEDYYAGKNFN